MGIKERRARQKTLLRQEILAAARDILVGEGYDGLSMRKVAERIDYSPTAIYLHFKDRDDLVFCVCEELMAGLVRELDDVVRSASNPVQALERALRRYVDFALQHPEYYIATFMVPRARDADVIARYKEPTTMHQRALSMLVQLVEAGVRERHGEPADVPAVSRAIWAGVHGVASLLITFPAFDWEDRDEVIDRLIGILVDGLAAPPRKSRLANNRRSYPMRRVTAVS